MVYVPPILLASPFTLLGMGKLETFYADAPLDGATATSFLDILTPGAHAGSINHLPCEIHPESAVLSSQRSPKAEAISLLSQVHTSFSDVPTSLSLVGLGISFESILSTSSGAHDLSPCSLADLDSSVLSLYGSTPLFPLPMEHHFLDGQMWSLEARHPLSVLSQELLLGSITQSTDSTSYTGSPASFMPLDSDFRSSAVGLFPDFTAYETAALAAETAILVPPCLSTRTPRDQNQGSSPTFFEHNDISHSNSPEYSMFDIISAFPRVGSLEFSRIELEHSLLLSST